MSERVFLCNVEVKNAYVEKKRLSARECHTWCPPDLTCSQVSQLREVLSAIKRQNAASLPTTPFQDSMTIETTLIDQHTTSYSVGCRQHTTPLDYTNTTSNTGPHWL